MSIEEYCHNHYQNAQLPITAYYQDGGEISECTVTHYGISPGAGIASIIWHHNSTPSQSIQSSVNHLHLTREAAEAELRREVREELLNEWMNRIDETLTTQVRTAFTRNTKEAVEKVMQEALDMFSEHLDAELDLSLNFRNSYKCQCGENWDIESDSMHNDRCPECDKETEPYECLEF